MYRNSLNKSLDDLKTVLKKIPQVSKTAKILNVSFNFFEYELKTKGIISRKFRNQIEEDISELNQIKNREFGHNTNVKTMKVLGK